MELPPHILASNPVKSCISLTISKLSFFLLFRIGKAVDKITYICIVHFCFYFGHVIGGLKLVR